MLVVRFLGLLGLFAVGLAGVASVDDSSFDSSIVLVEGLALFTSDGVLLVVVVVSEISVFGFFRCVDFSAAIVRIVLVLLDDGGFMLLLWLRSFACVVDFGMTNVEF